MEGGGRTTAADRLLERDGEIDALRAGIDGASGGSGRLLVVEAAAGLGKSRLLDVAVALARGEHATALSAHSSRLEREVPFGVARELLSPCASPERLTGLAAPVAALFRGQGGGAGTVQGLHALLAGCAAGGVVVAVVDDAQWCDRPTLRFLTYVATRAHSLPLVLVVAVQPGEPGAPEDLLAALLAVPDTVLLRPRPLSMAAVGQLVGGVTGADDAHGLYAACARASGGNPFHLRELVSALEARRGCPVDAVEHAVSPALHRWTALRLTSLGAECTSLARAVAVLGGGALRDAAAVAGLEPDEAERAADSLVAADVIAAGDPLRFVRPLTASAVGAGIPPFARARAHRRAADVLTRSGAPAEQVAAQLVRTRPAADATVVRSLRSAAATAVDHGEPLRAAQLLERALAEPPAAEQRAAVHLELARALARAGSAQALPRTRHALTLTEGPREEAHALGLLSRLLHHAGRYGEAAASAAQARSQLHRDDPLHPQLLAAFLDAAVLEPALLSSADAELAPLIAAARAGLAPTDSRLLAQLAVAMARAGDPPALVRRLAEKAVAGDPLIDADTHGVSLGYVAAAVIWVDELEAAEVLLDAAVDRAELRGVTDTLAVATHWRAITRFHAGRLDEAVADARRALRIYQAGSACSPWGTPVLLLALAARGELDAARAAVKIGERATPGGAEQALLFEARAEVALAVGDGEGALAAARLAGEASEGRYGVRNARIFDWRRLAALGAHASARPREAAELIEEHLAMVRALGAPRQLGATLCAAGAIAGGEEGVALLEEAVAVLERSPARLERARALTALGGALRRRGRVGEAAEPLHRGLELADVLGAAPLVRFARAELRAIGIRPRRAARSGARALTPSERRVAELAALGMSTPQIARELVVSPKTVESHLGAAYRKLAIPSRAGLPHALREFSG